MPLSKGTRERTSASGSCDGKPATTPHAADKQDDGRRPPIAPVSFRFEISTNATRCRAPLHTLCMRAATRQPPKATLEKPTWCGDKGRSRVDELQKANLA